MPLIFIHMNKLESAPHIYPWNDLHETSQVPIS